MANRYGTNRIPLILMAMIALMLSTPAIGATIDVDGEDPTCSDVTGTPFCTIQAAINASGDADTVLVMPGTYHENINFMGKPITVKSDQGPSATIIDGGSADTVAYFGNGETPASVLDGFTLQNGYAGTTATLAQFQGGGILIHSASPTIKNNVITDNVADLPGFGIDIYWGSPVIDGNTIRNNHGSGCCTGGTGGGGIAIVGGGSAQIINNSIIDNSCAPAFIGGGGIELFGAGTPIIRNNFISGNSGGSGGGISMRNTSNALILQNVIVNNTATTEGGGIYWGVPSGQTGPVVVNNTIVNNTSPKGSGVFADGYDALTELTNNLIIASPGESAVYCGDLNDTNPPIFNSNDIYSASGTAYAGICTNQTGQNGNISVAPGFLDVDSDNYRLDINSLVIDTGDSTEPNLPTTDFAGNTRIAGAEVDMGAYEFAPNAGCIEFSSSSFSTNEGASSATITVRRRAGKTGVVTVNFTTSDNTATAGSDYTAVSGTITFGDGDISDKTFTVQILDDGTFEHSENIALSLSNPSGGATLGLQCNATLSIKDNDHAPDISYPTEERSAGCFIETVVFNYSLVEEVK